MTGSPGQLAATLAAAIEADPIVASLIKETCPPEKLIRLLGLETHIGRVLAEEAAETRPLLDELAGTELDVGTQDKPFQKLRIPEDLLKPCWPAEIKMTDHGEHYKHPELPNG